MRRRVRWTAPGAGQFWASRARGVDLADVRGVRKLCRRARRKDANGQAGHAASHSRTACRPETGPCGVVRLLSLGRRTVDLQGTGLLETAALPLLPVEAMGAAQGPAQGPGTPETRGESGP